MWPTPSVTSCPSFIISRRNTVAHTLCFTRERTARWVEGQNKKALFRVLGKCSNALSFVSTELCRHWTMPSGSSATYWSTFTVTITKTRMSFAGMVTLISLLTLMKYLMKSSWVSLRNLLNVTLLPCFTVQVIEANTHTKKTSFFLSLYPVTFVNVLNFVVLKKKQCFMFYFCNLMINPGLFLHSRYCHTSLIFAHFFEKHAVFLLFQLNIMYRRGDHLPQHTDALLGLFDQQARGLQRYSSPFLFWRSLTLRAWRVFAVFGVFRRRPANERNGSSSWLKMFRFKG